MIVQGPIDTVLCPLTNILMLHNSRTGNEKRVSGIWSLFSFSVAANIKKSPKYFTCGEKHEIWHTYLSDNTVSKIIIGHRDFRHFQDGCR